MEWWKSLTSWIDPNRALNAAFVHVPPYFPYIPVEEIPPAKKEIPADYTQRMAQEFKPLQDRRDFGRYQGIESVWASYLYNPQTGEGRMLESHNAQHPVTPASTIKLYTLALATQAMKERQLTVNDEVTVPPEAFALEKDLNDEKKPEERAWILKPKMKVGDLMALTALSSNNSAALALGLFSVDEPRSEMAYANLANYTLREVIGVSNSLIMNPSGLPHVRSDRIGNDIPIVGEDGKLLENLQQITAEDAVRIYQWSYQQLPPEVRDIVGRASYVIDAKGGRQTIAPRSTAFHDIWPAGTLENELDQSMQVTNSFNKTGMIGEPNHRLYSRVAVRTVEVDGTPLELIVFGGGFSHTVSEQAMIARNAKIRELMQNALPELAMEARKEAPSLDFNIAPVCREPTYDAPVPNMTPAAPSPVNKDFFQQR